MSLFGSLFSGVSGLSAQSRAMGMISDNVANVNTTGFKGAAARFSTLVTGTSAVRNYSPGGVRALTYQTVTSQGLIQGTASPTDAAISGAGFFVVSAANDGSTEPLYTRAGAFEPDDLGDLRTPAGFYLQGWALGADEQVLDINQVETVNIRRISKLAAPTTSMTVGANLSADQQSHTGAYGVGDMAASAASAGATGVAAHFSRPVQVYDSLGRPHNLTLAFLKDDAPVNTWQVEVFADPNDVDAGVHADGLLASGTVTFNGDGTLASSTINPSLAGSGAGEIGIRWAAVTGAADSSVALDLGTPEETDGLTQFSSPTDVGYVDQNGSEVGELNGVSIDEDGYLVASFTNGENQRLYLLPIATFTNPTALNPRTGNVYSQTDASGESNLQAAGVGGAGKVTPSALEAANVDLAEEFTRMIITQRAYSANAKVITTTDEMLDELIRLRR